MRSKSRATFQFRNYLILLLVLIGGLEALGIIALTLNLTHLPDWGSLKAERSKLSGKDEVDPELLNKLSHAHPDDQQETIHPYLGYVYNPDKNNLEAMKRNGITPINDFGMVDLESPIRVKKPGELTIGILGGSVASWLSHSHALQVLEEGLKTTAPYRNQKLHFVHLAIGGFKQPQPLLLLTYLLSLGAHFDTIINLDGFNDVALPASDNYYQKINPHYPRNWAQIVSGLDSTDRQLLAGKIIWFNRLRERWAKLMNHSPLRQSALVTAVWKLGDQVALSSIAQLRTEFFKPSSKTNQSPTFPVSGPKKTYASIPEIMPDVISVWKQGSLQLHRLCEANGIHYYHFLQPNQYDKGSKPIGAAEAKVAILKEHAYEVGVRLGYPLLRRAGSELNQEGVHFSDLSKILSNHPEPLYIDNCCHLNVTGYEILAAAIAKAVSRDYESHGS